MLTKATTLFSSVFLLFVASQGLAAPNPQTSGTPVLHCGVDHKTCPPGWTCCGPLFPDVGGNCRKLGPDEVCTF
ncbi:hypothetical protein BDZ94DRAFT_1313930 [Collybia nuda]|uniref:Uncharacterized protein n=1 Tax=Collybia nuda TaxID=64659 RepID=A0A9P5XWB0_9AGAR|nr:hypothetical protein BDZ94DRAFT_1313930 [Collybia nuda]